MGIQAPGGALNVALNDTGRGAYTADGRLRVTDVAGRGITDASGAWRIASTVGRGVYQNLADAIRYVDASIDGATGVQAVSGPIRMLLGGTPPTLSNYITEDSSEFYITEDGSDYYVTEN